MEAESRALALRELRRKALVIVTDSSPTSQAQESQSGAIRSLCASLSSQPGAAVPNHALESLRNELGTERFLFSICEQMRSGGHGGLTLCQLMSLGLPVGMFLKAPGHDVRALAREVAEARLGCTGLTPQLHNVIGDLVEVACRDSEAGRLSRCLLSDSHAEAYRIGGLHGWMSMNEGWTLAVARAPNKALITRRLQGILLAGPGDNTFLSLAGNEKEQNPDDASTSLDITKVQDVQATHIEVLSRDSCIETVAKFIQGQEGDGRCLAAYTLATITSSSDVIEVWERTIRDLCVAALASDNDPVVMYITLLVRYLTSRTSRFPDYSKWFTQLFIANETSILSNMKMIRAFFRSLSLLMPREESVFLRIHIRLLNNFQRATSLATDYRMLAQTRLSDLGAGKDGGNAPADAAEEAVSSIGHFVRTQRIPDSLFRYRMMNRPWWSHVFVPLLLTSERLEVSQDERLLFIRALVDAKCLRKEALATFEETMGSRGPSVQQAKRRRIDDGHKDSIVKSIQDLPAIIQNQDSDAADASVRGLAHLLSLMPDPDPLSEVVDEYLNGFVTCLAADVAKQDSPQNLFCTGPWALTYASLSAKSETVKSRVVDLLAGRCGKLEVWHESCLALYVALVAAHSVPEPCMLSKAAFEVRPTTSVVGMVSFFTFALNYVAGVFAFSSSIFECPNECQLLAPEIQAKITWASWRIKYLAAISEGSHEVVTLAWNIWLGHSSTSALKPMLDSLGAPSMEEWISWEAGLESDTMPENHRLVYIRSIMKEHFEHVSNDDILGAVLRSSIRRLESGSTSMTPSGPTGDNPWAGLMDQVSRPVVYSFLLSRLPECEDIENGWCPLWSTARVINQMTSHSAGVTAALHAIWGGFVMVDSSLYRGRHSSCSGGQEWLEMLRKVLTNGRAPWPNAITIRVAEVASYLGKSRNSNELSISATLRDEWTQMAIALVRHSGAVGPVLQRSQGTEDLGHMVVETCALVRWLTTGLPCTEEAMSRAGLHPEVTALSLYERLTNMALGDDTVDRAAFAHCVTERCKRLVSCSRSALPFVYLLAFLLLRVLKRGKAKALINVARVASHLLAGILDAIPDAACIFDTSPPGSATEEESRVSQLLQKYRDDGDGEVTGIPDAGSSPFSPTTNAILCCRMLQNALTQGSVPRRYVPMEWVRILLNQYLALLDAKSNEKQKETFRQFMRAHVRLEPRENTLGRLRFLCRDDLLRLKCVDYDTYTSITKNGLEPVQ